MQTKPETRLILTDLDLAALVRGSIVRKYGVAIMFDPEIQFDQMHALIEEAEGLR